MLLDALMAATDRLIITYTGNDERTNIARPPAVPVGELLDMADRTARVEGMRVRDHVLVKHPLQPFDPRNYEPGRLVDGKPWSFDHVTLAGARALATDRPKPRAFLDTPLPGSPATGAGARGPGTLPLQPGRRVPEPAAGGERRRSLHRAGRRAAGRGRGPGPVADRRPAC